MFFPDKARGVREAFRVLRPGGTYLFNVWDRLEKNAAPRIAHETLRAFFPDDPPQFYQTPFNLHDTAVVRGLLDAAGFVDVESVTVQKVGESPSAHDAAVGLVEGNPVYGTIMERRPGALGDIVDTVARNIAAELGDRPARSPLSAHVFTAIRPNSGVRP
jgi:SAM-dependent methyltransferase